MIGTLTVFLIPGPFLQDTISRPPIYIFITRILFITGSAIWQAVILMVLLPPKSVNNLEASLIDGMCTAGKVELIFRFIFIFIYTLFIIIIYVFMIYDYFHLIYYQGFRDYDKEWRAFR